MAVRNSCSHFKRAGIFLLLFVLAQAAQAGTPNLTPIQQTGWSGSLVIAPVTGTTQAPNPLLDPQYSTDNSLYVDFAFQNNGSAAAGPFQVYLELDGTVIRSFQVTGLAVGGIYQQLDISLGVLGHGGHTVRAIADPTNPPFLNLPGGITPPASPPGQVVESNESDNIATTSIFVKYPVPVISSPATDQATAGLFYAYDILASGNATSYSIDVLPPGLAINSTTGRIEGSLPIDAAGPISAIFTFTVVATNSDGFFGSLIVTLTVIPQKPTITSKLQDFAYLGIPYTYSLTATGSPATITVVNLPQAGLVWDPSTLTISGTPLQDGLVAVQFTATNTGGTDQKTVLITISGPPTFRDTPPFFVVDAGQPFSKLLLASGNPETFFTPTAPAPGVLPANMKLNIDTGEINGTAVTPGTYDVFFGATNPAGVGTTRIVLAVKGGVNPAITSPLKVHAKTGENFYYKVTATDNPSQFFIDETTLPPGYVARKITITNPDPHPVTGLEQPDTVVFTGEITGVSVVAGTYSSSITATYFDSANVARSRTELLTFEVELVLPEVKEPLNWEMKIGSASSYQIRTNLTPVDYSYLPDPFTGLPIDPSGGLSSQTSFDPSTGIISSQPSGPANLYWARVGAFNAVGVGTSQILGVGIGDINSPTLSSPPITFATVGLPFNFQIQAGGAGVYGADLPWNLGPNPFPVGPPPDPPFNYPLGKIGLGVTANTGVISGTPTAAGTFFVRTFAGPVGGRAFKLLKLIVEPAGSLQPRIISANAVIGKFNNAFKYQFLVAPGKLTTTISYIGGDPIPAGLTINNTGGAFLEGTVTHTNAVPNPNFNMATQSVGPVNLNFTATNANGTSNTFTLTLVFYDQAATKPSITSDLSAITAETVPFSYLVRSTNNATSIMNITPLPAALTLDAPQLSTALLHGTTSVGGAFYDNLSRTTVPGNSWIMIQAQGATGVGWGVVKLTINPSPPIILPSTTAGATYGLPSQSNELGLQATRLVGLPFNYSINAGRFPTGAGPYVANSARFFVAQQLPAGLTLGYFTGTIDGITIGVNTNELAKVNGVQILNPDGTFKIATNTNVNTRVSAINSYGADTRTLQIGVIPVEITSENRGDAIVGNFYSYKITATGLPFRFDVQNLPPGLTFDVSNGEISGIPLVPSDQANPFNPVKRFKITLFAQNAWNTGSMDFSLRVSQIQGSPVINPPYTVTGEETMAFSYQISATPGPVTGYQALGLPPGLDIDTTSGLISGTPTSFGTFNVIVTATNPTGTGGKSLVFVIDPTAVVFAEQTPPDGVVDYAYNFNIDTLKGSQSIAYSVDPNTPLPPGLTLSGPKITGIPTTEGTFLVGVLASNPAGSNTKDFIIKIYRLPLISSPLTWANPPSVVGTTFPPYTITVTGSTEQLVLSAAPLPPGLSFSGKDGMPASGIPPWTIYGDPVPMQPVKNYKVTLTAHNIATDILSNANNPFPNDVKTLLITIDSMQITNVKPLLISGTVGITIAPYRITATGAPTSFSLAGANQLPRGLSLNETSGIITGTPIVAGTFSVTVQASNGPFGNAQADLIFAISDVLGAPAITSPLSANAAVNVPFTYTITATNAPPATWTATPTDPTVTWLSVTTNAGGNGLITGTPPPGSQGTYEIVLTSSNGKGSGSATLVLGVSTDLNSPAVLSPLTANGMVGQSFVYQIRGSRIPTSFEATINGQPLSTFGLELDAQGLISGIPTTSGVFTMQVTVKNGVGQGSANVTLTIIQATTPFILVSPPTVNAFVNESFFYVINAQFATSYGATGLPVGLTVDPVNGVISGLPVLAGSYPVVLMATNSTGTGTNTVFINVSQRPGSPAITSSLSTFGIVNNPFSYTITAAPAATSFSAVLYPGLDALPNNLSINTTTGVISGTPNAVGQFLVLISGVNAVGTGSALLNIGITTVLPQVTSATTLTGTVGLLFASTAIVASGATPITHVFTAPLPAGLTFNGTAISGMPTGPVGTFAVTLLSSNPFTGANPIATIFTFNILPPVLPTITTVPPPQGIVTVPYTFNLGVGGSQPVTVTINPTTPLPPGLTLSNGVISGTPTVGGSFLVTVILTNAAGTVSQNLVFTFMTIIPGADSDGDGFPDELEIFVGSNPLDPFSTPLPSIDTDGDGFSDDLEIALGSNPLDRISRPVAAPVPSEPFHLPKPKLSIKLSFNKVDKDAISLSGSLPIPAGFTAPGQSVIVNIGGVIVGHIITNPRDPKEVILNSKGKFVSADKRIKVSISATRASTQARNAKYSIKLTGSFQTKLVDEKLLNETVQNELHNVEIIIIIERLVFRKIQPVLYSAKAGKSGSAK